MKELAITNPEYLKALQSTTTQSISQSVQKQETSGLNITSKTPASIIGKLKSKISKKERSSVDFEDHEDQDVDNFQENDSQSVSSQGSDSSRGSTTKKLIKIQKEIENGKDLSKRQKRLLQNRKSALKCRLKKQN